MPAVNVVLTSYDKREGQGQRGPWTLHLFKDSAGGSYQTFEAPISNRAYGFLGKPVVLEYEEKPSKGTNAQGQPYPPNRDIKDISLDTSASAVTEAPGAAQTPPTTFPISSVTSGGDDRQIQIMRQSALERAIRVLNVEGYNELSELYALSDQFLHYFQTGEYPGKSEQEFLAAANELAA